MTRKSVASGLRSLPAVAGLVVVLAAGPGSAPAPASAPASSWEPPLGAPVRVSEPYSLPNGPFRAGHRGIDLPARTGDPVRAPADGVVSFAGTVVDRPVLSIRVDARTVVSFEPVTTGLAIGDRVARGEEIALVAAGGHCPSACLHLGVRVDREYVNPLRYLRPRPVLLPW